MSSEYHSRNRSSAAGQGALRSQSHLCRLSQTMQEHTTTQRDDGNESTVSILKARSVQGSCRKTRMYFSYKQKAPLLWASTLLVFQAMCPLVLPARQCSHGCPCSHFSNEEMGDQVTYPGGIKAFTPLPLLSTSHHYPICFMVCLFVCF